MEELRPKYGGRWIVPSVLVAACFAGALFYFLFRSSKPEDAIRQIQQALSTRDKVLFEQYVHTDAVIDGLIEASMEYSYSDEEDSLELSSTTKRQLNELENQLQSILLPQWKGQLDRYFEFGDLSDNSKAGGLAAFWRKSDLTELTEVKEIERQGNIAIVSVGLFKPTFDTTLNFTLRLRREGQIWRLIDARSLMIQKSWLKQIENKNP